MSTTFGFGVMALLGVPQTLHILAFKLRFGQETPSLTALRKMPGQDEQLTAQHKPP